MACWEHSPCMLYMEPVYVLYFGAKQPSKKRSFPIKIRVIWVLGRLILLLFLPSIISNVFFWKWLSIGLRQQSKYFALDISHFFKSVMGRTQSIFETSEIPWNTELGGGFFHIFYFHPYLWKWSNLTTIFFNKWVDWSQQLVTYTENILRGWRDQLTKKLPIVNSHLHRWLNPLVGNWRSVFGALMTEAW